MSTTRGHLRLGLLFAGVGVLGASACGSGSSPSAGVSNLSTTGSVSFSGTLKFGLLVVLSGPYASIGNTQKTGFNMALQEINAKGGILGKQVVIDTQDSGADPTKSVQGARKLVQQDGVTVLFGPTLSVETTPVLPITQPAKAVEFGTSVTPPVDTSKYPFYYRLSPPSALQAKTFVAFMQQKGWTKAGLLAVNSPLGSSNIAAFNAAIQGTGISVVGKQIHESGTVDLTPQVQSLKGANPDVVLVFNTAVPDLIASVKARNALLWNVPMLGFSSMAFPDVTQGVGTQGMANVFAGQVYKQLTVEGAPKATTDWLARLRTFEGVASLTTDASQAAVAYDAVMMYADAVNNVHSLDPAAVRAYREQNPYQGIADVYKFSSANHDGVTLDGITFIQASSFHDGLASQG